MTASVFQERSPTFKELRNSLRTKKKRFACSRCKQAVALAHPTCERCKQAMDADGDKFLDYVSVSRLRENPHYEGLYVFNLSLGPVLINGMTYSPASGSIRFPKCVMGYRTVRPVTAFGTFLKPLRAKLDQEIAKLEHSDNDADEVEVDSAQDQVAA